MKCDDQSARRRSRARSPIQSKIFRQEGHRGAGLLHSAARDQKRGSEANAQQLEAQGRRAWSQLGLEERSLSPRRPVGRVGKWVSDTASYVIGLPYHGSYLCSGKGLVGARFYARGGGTKEGGVLLDVAAGNPPRPRALVALPCGGPG